MLAGRVRKGSERSCMVGRSWQRTRNQEVMGRMKSPRARDASVAANLVPGQPGGGGKGMTRGF